MNHHIPNPLEALKANVAVPFEQARAMPPGVCILEPRQRAGRPSNWPGQVRIGFGGGMSADYVNDAQAHFKQLKTLLDEVNVKDRGCTEKVFRGLSSRLAKPGHLSHLERLNYDFARYLNQQINGG